MKQINDLVLELSEAKYSPDDIRNMVTHALDGALHDLIKTKYTIFKFDSPEGYYSETKLKQEGYLVKWYGPIGHRGETYVYLPRPVEPGVIQKLESVLDAWGLTDGYTRKMVI